MLKKKCKKTLSIMVIAALVLSMAPTIETNAASSVAKVKIKTVKATKKSKIKVTWKKIKGAKGYQIRVLKNKKVVYRKTTRKRKLTTKKLTAGTYKVKVRAFKKVGGKKKYGSWSKAKKVTVTGTTEVSTTVAETENNTTQVETTTSYTSGETTTSYTSGETTTASSGNEVTTKEQTTTKPANEETTKEEETVTVSNDDVDGSVTFANGSASVSANDGAGISSTTDDTSITTVSITSAGTFKLSGATTNTVVDVKKGLSDTVELILDNLTVDNSTYATTANADSPIISIGKDTNVVIELVGENTLTGSDSYVSEPEAIISQKGTAPTLTIINAGDGVLNITDSMESTTDFGDLDPSDGIATKGTLTLKSGTYNIKVNGDALKGTGTSGAGGVTIENGTYNIESYQSSAIKSKNGIIAVSGGTVNSNYTAGDAIKATNYNVEISGGTINIDNCYGDGIQAEWVIISGGYTDITTYFENAGLNYYNSALSTHNSMTVSESGNAKTKVETVNVDTGSHKGIKGGTKAESYKYTTVEDGSEYTAGTTYTTSASGGIKITGGTVIVDTTNTGIKYNGSGGGNMGRPGQQGGSSSSTGNISQANSDGQYIIGAPEDGIKSNNDFEISGGKVYIKAADDGISTAGTLTITGEAVVNVEQAYEGIEASTIVVGTNGSSSNAPYVSVYTNDDGINASGKSSISYVYADESEETYTKTTVSTMSGHDMTIYSGTVVVMIADDTTHTFSLAVKDGQGVVSDGSTTTGSYSANGDGIDCNGSFYAYGGTTVVWGASSNDNSLIDTGDSGASYVIGSGATVFLAAASSGMTNNPTTLSQNAVVFSSSSSITSGKAFAILNSSNSTAIAAKATKSVAYIFYSASNLSGTYTLSSGGSVSGVVNSNSNHDGRYSSYNTSGASSLATATASTTISGGGNQGGPGGQFGPGGR